MDLDDYLTSITADGERLGELSGRDLTATVPPCPGWTVADLVVHVTRVFTMVNTVFESNTPPERLAALPDGEDVAARYDDAFRRLLDNFATVDPELERWNWSVGPQVASFWWRRMAHEAAVHRWDGEAAFGEPQPVPPRLAADGIDEWFDVHLRSDIVEPEVTGDATGTIHVHATDTEGEWWASLTDRTLELERVHRKGDVAVRGSACDLLLVLWGRRPPSTVEVLGDGTVLDSWLAVPDI